MATIDYIQVPPYATRLQSTSTATHDTKRLARITTSLPDSTSSSTSSPSTPTRSRPQQVPTSPTSPSVKASMSISNILPSLLVSSSSLSANPRRRGKQPALLSTSSPLSLPITTVNFRRFVASSGPIFWLQDRVEEIVMWRQGSLWTSMWISAYAFLCYFPRMVLLIPHITLISIILATQSGSRPSDTESDEPQRKAPATGGAKEGSVDWQANLQAIQNLMGAVSDMHDACLPLVPHLTNTHPQQTTTPLLVILALTFLFALPVLPLLPLRPICFVLGVFPLLCTHPRVLPLLIPAWHGIWSPDLRMRIEHLRDDANLRDEVWAGELRTVELWENERWTAESGWSKTALKVSERKAWTRGRDGWSGIGEGGQVSNLTFALARGWAFVESEDWRVDLCGSWCEGHADEDGWVYTNDAWLEPDSSRGVTRRRRWLRRIYYHGEDGEGADA